ncbi:MAG: hypothetical protein JST40_12370 [Armatimonadetes bacterium]|nr:hypothetical protein [Armatimonadota bacterium]
MKNRAFAQILIRLLSLYFTVYGMKFALEWLWNRMVGGGKLTTSNAYPSILPLLLDLFIGAALWAVSSDLAKMFCKGLEEDQIETKAGGRADDTVSP